MEKNNQGSVKVVVVLLAFLVAVALAYFHQVQLLHYTQEYVAGTRNIKGDVDVEWFTQRGPEFAIGQMGTAMRCSNIRSGHCESWNRIMRRVLL